MLNLNQQINRLGKYLNKHIDGAYDYHTESNICIVNMLVYYQIPKLMNPGEDKQLSDIKEMDIEINITTYKDAIRVNLNEITPQEATIGFLKYSGEDIVFSEVLFDIQKKIRKRFQDYEFVF